MAFPLIPFIKAAGPYIAQIAASAIPAFTSKPEGPKSDPVVAQQIKELQDAATQNALQIHGLAEKIQQAIQGIESSAGDIRRQVATYKILLFSSLAMSAASLLMCLYLISK